MCKAALTRSADPTTRTGPTSHRQSQGRPSTTVIAGTGAGPPHSSAHEPACHPAEGQPGGNPEPLAVPEGSVRDLGLLLRRPLKPRRQVGRGEWPFLATVGDQVGKADHEGEAN